MSGLDTARFSLLIHHAECNDTIAMFTLRAGRIGFSIGISERRRPNAGFATGHALTARVSTAASSIAMDAFRRTTASPRPHIQEMLPAKTGLMMKIGNMAGTTFA